MQTGKSTRVVGITVVVLVVLSGATVAGTKIEWDENAVFERYSSYSFKEGTPAPGPLDDERVVAIVAAELENAGLTSAAAAPDLYVVRHVAAGHQLQVFTETPRHYPLLGSSYPNFDQHNETTIVLEIRLIDARTGQTVWRAGAFDALADDPEKNQKRVEKMVRKLFRRYPPR